MLSFFNKKHKARKPLLIVPVAPDWTHDDAAKWKQFLQSDTGQTLWLRVRAIEAAASIKACCGEGDPKIAGGMSNAFNWLEGLATISVASAAQEVNYEDLALGDAGIPDTKNSYT